MPGTLAESSKDRVRNTPSAQFLSVNHERAHVMRALPVHIWLVAPVHRDARPRLAAAGG